MKNPIKAAIASIKELPLARILLVAIACSLLLLSNPAFAGIEKPVGERVGEKQHETSVKSERPKTLGEFRKEADGDVPLDQRAKNITRDSGEAFKQFGQGITNSITETAKELTGNKQS